MIYLSRDDRGRLGSFDPGCFTVDFRSPTADIAPGTDARLILGRVPDPLLAHEFAHFLHATGTRAGIHNYALSVDYALGLSALTVVRQFGPEHDGRIVEEQEMADLHRSVTATVSSMLVTSGGIAPDGDP
ncbi:MAG TPA: hypothetical protein VGX49_12790, partial [Jatrophihabitans sp.]|nr:hypothetical protein [Jatrophihabitans sp.]